MSPSTDEYPEMRYTSNLPPVHWVSMVTNIFHVPLFPGMMDLLSNLKPSFFTAALL